MINDTIAAISTAYGRGGIAVIRISGEDAILAAGKCFLAANGLPLEQQAHGHCVYGAILKGGVQIDDGMCTVFRAPHSYTGEDTAEISCHGGILLTEKVLEAVFEAGARQAGPGEFTRRAFTNGKLSLSQAEAVGLLIDAVSEEQLALAVSHERGVVKKKADALYEQLKTIVTGVYANVDFPDEDLAELSGDEVLASLADIRRELEMLKSSYRVGRAVCEGIQTAIAGKPNTGKSSLLNRLVGRERAIVTDIAGTTRDTIEETVLCGRVMLRLADTAGIHTAGDEVERIGVERSLAAIAEAELIFAVFDRSRPLDQEDAALLEKLDSCGGVKIALLNKCDLPAAWTENELAESGIFAHILEISAEHDRGIDALRRLAEDLFAAGEIDYNERAVIASARQNASVSRALEFVKSAESALSVGLSTDMAGFDLEAALSELSELDGRRVTEEIVDGIFHRFCVGK